ncbi:MAG: NTP transferase domain-containing protein [Methanobacteriaceae archaeon]|nr:NTP transferase domain-containing protein [Methanobacteriaceae archaeon]
MVVALIMAGGKGSRMKLSQEKPMITINNKTMVEKIIEATQSCKYIERTLVAVSPNTPNTRKFLLDFPVEIIDTKGEGYIEDLGNILTNEKYVDKDEVVCTIVADLPFLTSKILDTIFEKYNSTDKPALSVYLPIELFKENNVQPSFFMDNIVPSGVNIVIANDKPQDENIFILNDSKLVYNVNTISDLKSSVAMQKFSEDI